MPECGIFCPVCPYPLPFRLFSNLPPPSASRPFHLLYVLYHISPFCEWIIKETGTIYTKIIQGMNEDIRGRVGG